MAFIGNIITPYVQKVMIMDKPDKLFTRAQNLDRLFNSQMAKRKSISQLLPLIKMRRRAWDMWHATLDLSKYKSEYQILKTRFEVLRNENTMLKKQISDMEFDAGMSAEAFTRGREHLAKVGIEAAFIDDCMGQAAYKIETLETRIKALEDQLSDSDRILKLNTRYHVNVDGVEITTVSAKLYEDSLDRIKKLKSQLVLVKKLKPSN